MEKLAYGYLGLTPNQLDQHTTDSLQAAIQGRREQEEEAEKQEWQRTRFLAFYLRNLWLEKPLKRPTDWFKFEWEKQSGTTQVVDNTEVKAKTEALNNHFDKVAAKYFK